MRLCGRQHLRLEVSDLLGVQEEAAAGQWASLLQEEDRPASDLGSFQNLNEVQEASNW